MNKQEWFRGDKQGAAVETSEALVLATEAGTRLLRADERRIAANEQALTVARDTLNRSHEIAQENAAALAVSLQQVIDAAKAAQIAEENEASLQIEQVNQALAQELEALEAQHKAACAAAQREHDARVAAIAGRMSSDRDKLLPVLVEAAAVLSSAQSVAIGW
jgi:hypothetical protein